MKPMAGGEIDNATLALKYFHDKPKIVPLVGFESTEEIKEIVKIVETGDAFTEDELNQIADIRSEIGKRFCRRFIQRLVEQRRQTTEGTQVGGSTAGDGDRSPKTGDPRLLLEVAGHW